MGIMAQEDQITAAKLVYRHCLSLIYSRYINDKFGYVKSDSTGIWGWSYGGYTTAMVMTNGSSSNPFSMGMSVAPPVDWTFYGMHTYITVSLSNNRFCVY